MPSFPIESIITCIISVGAIAQFILKLVGIIKYSWWWVAVPFTIVMLFWIVVLGMMCSMVGL